MARWKLKLIASERDIGVAEEMSVYGGILERLGEGWKWKWIAMYGDEVRVRV